MKPLLKWAGGKRWLARLLQLPPSRRYVEPFFGSGAVFFANEQRVSLISDSNPSLIEMYREVRSDWRGVVDALKAHRDAHCREHYYRVRADIPANSTHRAARFLYLNRTCWNGLYRENLKGQFNVPMGSKTQVFLPDDDFEGVGEKLKRATINCGDFENIVRSCGEGDLVFVDPPYTVKHNNNGFIKYNENIFTWSDQVRLCAAVKHAHENGARLIITNAFHPSVLLLYESFAETTEVFRQSVLAAKSSHRGRTSEALITVGLRPADVLKGSLSDTVDCLPRDQKGGEGFCAQMT